MPKVIENRSVRGTLVIYKTEDCLVVRSLLLCYVGLYNMYGPHIYSQGIFKYLLPFYQHYYIYKQVSIFLKIPLFRDVLQ